MDGAEENLPLEYSATNKPSKNSTMLMVLPNQTGSLSNLMYG